MQPKAARPELTLSAPAGSSRLRSTLRAMTSGISSSQVSNMQMIGSLGLNCLCHSLDVHVCAGVPKLVVYTAFFYFSMCVGNWHVCLRSKHVSQRC